jgi:hypothetical protein
LDAALVGNRRAKGGDPIDGRLGEGGLGGLRSGANAFRLGFRQLHALDAEAINAIRYQR